MAHKSMIFTPGRTVLLSIFATICLGTLLLLLPVAQRTPITPLDCFFTATSATCVTGALTVPFESFTLFGQLVILLLIQIGGIGLLTLTLFLVSLFLNIGLSTQSVIGQILELESWRTTRQVLFFIVAFTLILECIGAGVIYQLIKHQYTPPNALFHALFHSISSFNNAGLSSFGTSMLSFSHNIPMLAITALLMIGGSFGFITWYELFLYGKARLAGKRFHLSLTTRVVLSMNALVITFATLLLIALEGPGNCTHWLTTVANMLFNAIAYRSTGFTTLNTATIQQATVFFIIMYSFIGAAPASTGGGIKITTFTLFLATIRAVTMGRTAVDLKGRQIPQDLIFKAMAVLSLSLCWIIISTFLLLLIESKASFIALFFETVSSFTTLGLVTDITPYLSAGGKLLIITNMFIGRVGSLTLLLALKTRPDKVEFHYPEERLMLS